MPPRRVPIVSTGRWNDQARMEARPTAIRKPGQVGRKRRIAMITPIAAVLKVGSAVTSASTLGMIGPGSDQHGARSAHLCGGDHVAFSSI